MLPAIVNNLISSIQKTKSNLSQQTGTGGAYLKLDKTGTWIYGEEETEVEDDTRWAINPNALYLGFVAWKDAVKLGEEMAMITDTPIARDTLPEVGGQWNTQMGMSLVGTNGTDKGVQLQYVNSSRGSINAFNEVLDAILERAQEGKTDLVPLVNLQVDSYKHKKYGRVFVPILDVVAWADMDAVVTEVKDEEPPHPNQPKK